MAVLQEQLLRAEKKAEAGGYTQEWMELSDHWEAQATGFKEEAEVKEALVLSLEARVASQEESLRTAEMVMLSTKEEMLILKKEAEEAKEVSPH